MRIIAGTARGTVIDAPQGRDTRPTLDRVRENVFNILQQQVRGARVLDLFSGSGAMAFEAVSRGAASAVLVDVDKKAHHVEEANCRKLRMDDRCRLLLHVVDVSGSECRDPIEDFEKINEELRQYSPDLAARPMIVAANKADLLPPDSDNLERLKAHVEAQGYEFYVISAATTKGTKELMRTIAGKLANLPPVTVYEPEYVPKPVKIDASEPLKITVEDNTYIVEGKWLERLMSNINFGDYESRMFFDKMLRENGVFQQLEDLGIKDGDIVSMYELEFEYQH